MNKPVERIVDAYPNLGTGTIPIEPYVSHDYFENEREKIFRHSWLCIGREDQVPNPGDYFVRDIKVVNVSIIVVRGKDGLVRTFHNSCQHRGNKLVFGGCASVKNFSCGFHGWVYDLSGHLVDVPDERNFYDIDKSSRALKPVTSGVWQGFIFINVDPNPLISLQEWAADINKEVDGYEFDKMRRLGSYKAEVRANWKLVLDAFQEAYHVAFVHRLSASGSFTSEANPHCGISSVRLYERNRRASVYANPDFSPPPSAAIAFKYGPTFASAAQADLSKLPSGINPERKQNWGFDIFVVFPIFRFDPGQGWYFSDNFWPLDENHTLYEFSLYMPPPKNAGELISQEQTRVLLRDIVREDLSTLETTQEALETGGITEMVLSDQEILCRHQQVVVDRIINGAS